jgi:alanyl-tRNA synthetase
MSTPTPTPTRIYYTDPYCLEFDATVTAVTPAPEQEAQRSHPGSHPAAADRVGGPGWRVVLDRSAFYPTSGGQPFDIGTLDTAHVREVSDENGEVEHITDAPLVVGQRVHAVIDGARRRDHMQQHTGQHVLSAAFDRLLNIRTESFHLGATSATIDLAREVTAAEIARAEEAANQIVWEDRPVAIRFVTPEEAATLPLRKEPKKDGELRLIDIAEWDLSACGGTHVARTGEIGIIAVRSWERFKGKTRVEFVCGRRALATFHELRDAITGSVRQLSVMPAELPAAIERALNESKDLRYQLRQATQKLAGHEAETLAAAAESIGGAKCVIAAVEGYDAGSLKTLAISIAREPGRVAAVITNASPSAIVVTRSADVALDSAAILKAMTSRFGGKGGGKPEMAQGGGLSGPPPDIVSALRGAIEQALIPPPRA